jgi:RNA polymerase sigma factor (sigma-70 family)
MGVTSPSFPMTQSEPKGTLQRIAERVRWYSGALRAEFDRLYARAVGLAKRTATERRLEKEDAEDLAARICDDLPAAFVGGAVSPDDDAGLARWVRRRVVSSLPNMRRARRRRASLGEAFAAEMTDSESVWMNPQGQAELNEMRSQLLRASAKLSPVRQKVFLQLYEGRPQEEIAEQMGLKHQTVRKHASEIYELLREAMASYREDWRPTTPSWYNGGSRPSTPEGT